MCELVLIFQFCSYCVLLLLSGFNHFIVERNIIKLFYFMIPCNICCDKRSILIAGYANP